MKPLLFRSPHPDKAHHLVICGSLDAHDSTPLKMSPQECAESRRNGWVGNFQSGEVKPAESRIGAEHKFLFAAPWQSDAKDHLAWQGLVYLD